MSFRICHRFAPLLAVGLGAVVAPAAPASTAVHVETACFSVTNPGDAAPSTLYGKRYTVGHPSASTPAIVLVHGVASSTDNWDFSPRWSVARSLARAGYVVISYDRLGFDRSVYAGPGGGFALTTPNQRDMLHQVVTAVKAGAYTTGRGPSCASAGTPSDLASGTVVIIGHSAGGAIVEGYPGRYHDVAAMVTANWSNQPAPDPVPLPANPVPIPGRPDYIAFFSTRQECSHFNVYRPGVKLGIAHAACNPAGFVATPIGEFTGFAQLEAETNEAIPATGSIPVLLTYGEHDIAFPLAATDEDYAYWLSHCPGCDVTRWVEPDSGHLFMVHGVLPQWIDEVVTWLGSRGIAPS